MRKKERYKFSFVNAKLIEIDSTTLFFLRYGTLKWFLKCHFKYALHKHPMQRDAAF